MARNYLTPINLNKNELQNARIQNLSTAPSSPAAGQIYYNTSDATLRYWDGTAWVTLAQGGSVTEAIEAAIAALTTDDITEGTTNLYFTDQRALTATASAYDTAGAAAAVASDLSDHTGDSSGVHGVTGTVVGTTDVQTLSNKTIDSSGLSFVNGGQTSSISASNDDLNIAASGTINLNTSTGDIVLNPDGNAYLTSAVDGNQIATHSYVDGLAQGLNVKDSVRVASAVDVDIANATEVDGVTLSSGDRVLLFGQNTASENGIYVFTTSLARAADQPTVDKGDYTLVTNGTYAATGWIATSTTAWTQFSAANEYTAGDGIDITGNAISVKLDSDSLVKSGSGLKVNYHTDGGLDNDSGLYVKLGTGLDFDGSGNVTLAAGYGVKKYSENNGALTASGGQVTWTVTHNIGTRDVTVQLFELATYAQVEVDVVRTDGTTVTLSWVSGNVSADAYRVVIVG